LYKEKDHFLRTPKEEESAMKKLLVLLPLLFFLGCTHLVEFNPPETHQYSKKIPLTAVFHMDGNLQQKEVSFRAAGSGLAHKWVVPVGETVRMYALSNMQEAFSSFSEVSSLDALPPHDILIQVTAIDFYMRGQAAHSDITFSVKKGSAEVFNKKYHEDGPSGAGRVFGGGVFAQKSAVRASTHSVMENIFGRFLADVRAGHKKW
jgi:hypothetical protein